MLNVSVCAGLCVSLARCQQCMSVLSYRHRHLAVIAILQPKVKLFAYVILTLNCLHSYGQRSLAIHGEFSCAKITNVDICYARVCSMTVSLPKKYMNIDLRPKIEPRQIGKKCEKILWLLCANHTRAPGEEPSSRSPIVHLVVKVHASMTG